MITVRFPNGQAIQYNDASYCTRSVNGYSDLYTKKDGTWIAQVPNTALIESVRPCSITNPVAREMTPESALALVTEHLRTLPGHKVRDLKVALRAFNARSRTWREAP